MLLLVTTAACGITSDYGGTRFRCDEGGRCPSGFQCVANFCEGGVDPGQDGGDTQADAFGGTGSCAGLNGLQDDFNAETLDTRRWQAYPDGTVPGIETGGVFVSGGLLYLGGARSPDGAAGEVYGVRAIEPRTISGTLSVVFSDAAAAGGAQVSANVRVGARGQEVRVDLVPFQVTVAGQPPTPMEDTRGVRRLEIAFSDDRRTVTVRVATAEGTDLRPVGTWEVSEEIGGANAEVILEAGPGQGDPTADNTYLVIDSVGIEPGGGISCPPEGG